MSLHLTNDDRKAQALFFVRMLFGYGCAPPGAQVTISVPNLTPAEREPNWWSIHLPASDLVAVAEASLEIDAEDEVYFGCGLRVGDLGMYHRGRADQVVAIPGAWCDLDLLAPGHVAKNLPTIEQAYELLRALNLPPTVIVHSGGGLHVWWLFSGLWSLTNETERTRATRLLAGLQAQLTALATARGFHLDNVAELSRVLRLPGTRNKKFAGQPRPVQILFANGPRHDRDALLARFESLAPTKSIAPRHGRALTAEEHAASPSLLVLMFYYSGMLGPALSDGRYAVACPWEAEHTSGRRFDSSTILWPATRATNLGGFHCLHGHCKGRRRLEDVLAALPAHAVARAQAEHDHATRAQTEKLLAKMRGARGAAPLGGARAATPAAPINLYELRNRLTSLKRRKMRAGEPDQLVHATLLERLIKGEALMQLGDPPALQLDATTAIRKTMGLVAFELPINTPAQAVIEIARASLMAMVRESQQVDALLLAAESCFISSLKSRIEMQEQKQAEIEARQMRAFAPYQRR